MITSIKSAPPAPINDDVIRILNEALEEAKRGEISDLALCYIRPNGIAGNNFSYGKNKAVSIIGALTVLSRDVVDKCKSVRSEE